MYRIIFTLSFILASLAASAQQSGGWTLRQCIDYALENNITVKQQDVTRRQNEVQLSTAKNSRLPDLNASASQNWSFGRGLTSENTYSNRNTSSTSLSLGTTVPLFTGFRIPRTIELNKLNLEAATADLGKARDDISVQVAQAYVQILYNIELRDVAQRQIDIDSMQVERLREMYRTGKASGVEVAQQEATLAQSRLTLTQADNDYRSSTDQMKFIFVKSSKGTMVPLDTLLRPKLTSGPSNISRFNGTRSIQITGQTGNGYSSGQAMNAIKEVVQQNAGTGFNIEWSGQSREEAKASSSTMQVLVLSLVFVFLCLAALYESWSVPFAVLLTVPTGIFGAVASEYGLSILEAMFGHQNAGLQDSVYMQIGIIAIIGLAAKNAILIVEFAKVRVDRGMEPVKAAIEAAGLRLRPILMTSFAFIIGCIPLAIATGAGAAARNGMGVAVVGGMPRVLRRHGVDCRQARPRQAGA